MNGAWAETFDGELLERLSKATGAMMFIVNLKPATLWVNEVLVETTGYTLEDYQFQRFESPFIPPEDTSRLVEALGRFLASESGVSEVVRNRFIDRWGGTLQVRSRITKIIWRGEKALLYTTFLEDDDPEQALDQQLRYRSLVESAADPIVRLLPDLTVQYSNRCFQVLLGLQPLALSTLKFTDLVLEEQRATVAAQLATCEEHVTLSAAVRSGRGPVWLEGTFVRTRRGRDVGMLDAILRDTTERRLLDARVQQAQKRESLGQLAGGIAHDLNNILTGIMGSATLAEAATQHGRSAAEPLADIRLAAQRAGELSSSMLAYAGEGTVLRVPVELGALAAEMKPLLAAALPKNVDLQVVITGEAPVMADEIQLRQVIMNLIVNAADASKSGGGPVTVHVGSRVLPAEDGVGVRECALAPGERTFGTQIAAGPVAFARVEDRGAGMSPEVLTKIFDPFFSTKARGRGLGLAAVLGILGRHGGCVRVRSQVGVGTTMEILLPLTKERPRPAATVVHTPTRGEGTILVVDDEPQIRRVVRKAFEGLGYRVLEAGTGEEGLRLLAEKGDEVRVVVLDQSMPGMGGVKTLGRIREHFPLLPVVRTSGHSAEVGAPENDSRCYFLGKPYGTPRLIEVVQQALSEA